MAEVKKARIFLRRGTDADRLQTDLCEGELGYSTDGKRVFVGDGSTNGGKSLGSSTIFKAEGFDTTTLTAVSSNGRAEVGDFVFTHAADYEITTINPAATPATITPNNSFGTVYTLSAIDSGDGSLTWVPVNSAIPLNHIDIPDNGINGDKIHGGNISGKAELLSRLTACQTTLTLNDTSVTKFERNKLVNKIFGNSIKNTFKTNDINVFKDTNLIGCSASHNGYNKNFGCTHKRDIFFDKEKNYLKGTDHIFKKKDGIPIRYVFRFHINPKFTVIKTMGGNSALIQVSKNKSLIFTANNELIEIEKSIFLGGEKILDNACINISGNLVNKNKSFSWEIKKNI